MKQILIIIALLLLISCNANKKFTNSYSPQDYQGEIKRLSNSENKDFIKTSFIGLVIDQDSRENIPFVTLRLRGHSNEYYRYSDTSGKIQIENIQFGKYKIEVWFVGYYPFMDSIYIDSQRNNAYQIELILNPEATF